MNVLYFVSDGLSEYNSSHFRVSNTADAIRGRANVRILNIKHWLLQTDMAYRSIAWADIVHLQRVMISDTHKVLDKWTRSGKAIVVDVDDHYNLIHDDNASADFWLHGRVNVTLESGISYKRQLDEHPIKQFTDGLPHISGLTSPSKVLCDWWAPHLPTYFIPNYLKVDRYENAPRINNGDDIILFWGGSLSHTQSWRDSGIQQALSMVLRERQNVHLLIVGDKRVVDMLPLPKNRIRFLPYVRFEEWPNVLQIADIGLAPLAGRYDDGRSSLKVDEYVASSIPFVASASPVYGWYQKHGAEGGLFAKHDDITLDIDERIASWHLNLIDMIDNLAYYQGKVSEMDRERLDAKNNVDYVLREYGRVING